MRRQLVTHLETTFRNIFWLMNNLPFKSESARDALLPLVVLFDRMEEDAEATVFCLL